RALSPGVPAGARLDVLRLQGEQIALCPDAPPWIDAQAFAAAAAAARLAEDPAAYDAALGLYTGDLLPEDRYEDWATGRLEALRTLYLDLLLDLARLHEARQEFPAAIGALQ